MLVKLIISKIVLTKIDFMQLSHVPVVFSRFKDSLRRTIIFLGERGWGWALTFKPVCMRVFWWAIACARTVSKVKHKT